MNTYCIYLPPNGTRDTDKTNAKFLVDGKSLFAVLAPPLWLIWYRMWWGLVIYLALLAILALLFFTPLREAVLYLSAIPGIYLMLEGNELLRQKHERQGWRFVGVVQGHDIGEAELRYFENTRPEASEPALPAELPAKTPDSHIIPSQSIGLFPLES